MALKAQPSEADVILLGYTRPREYDAGVIGNTRFDAGRSYRVVVGHDEHDFTVLKVKSANVDQTWQVIQDCGRMVELTIAFYPGTQDRQAELIACRRSAKSNGASKAPAAASAS